MPEGEPDFTPIERKRTSHVVENRIREAIFSKRSPVGTKLPTEREFAEMFQVSRNSVRQALLSLEREGFIRIKNGTRGGAFVSKDLSTRAVELMTNMFQFDEISLEEILQARLLIETFTAAQAAKNATPRQIRRLREGNLSLQQKYKKGSIRKYKPEIHSMIAEITSNRVIVFLMQILTSVHTQRITSVNVDDAQKKKILRQHEEIIEAIVHRDSQSASRAMKRHILTIHELHKKAVIARGVTL